MNQMVMLEILQATVITEEQGSDMVYLTVNLPEAQFPYTGKLDLKFRAAKGNGVNYVKQHFSDAPLKVIEG